MAVRHLTHDGHEDHEATNEPGNGLGARHRPGPFGDEARGKGGPSSLMAGAAAAASLGMKVLVELHQVAPVRIRGMTRVGAVTGSAARLVPQEDRRQPPRDLACDL